MERRREPVFPFLTSSAPPQSRATLHVVAYDFGIKQNILRRLVHSGCKVTVVPSPPPPKM